MNFQPPDPPEEGNCRRCKAWIGRDELLIDGCTECEDLLISDMAKLWAGRPKSNGVPVDWYTFYQKREFQGIRPGTAREVDWRGLI